MFEVAHCPPNRTILAWIEDEMGIWPPIETRFEPHQVLPGFAYNQQRLADECRELAAKIGFVPWRSRVADSVVGLSLHYDPQAPQSEIYDGSFGHPRYRAADQKVYSQLPARELPQAKRVDYLDILGFRLIGPEITALPEMMRILSGFAVPVVRGSVRVVLGPKSYVSGQDSLGMHMDVHPSKAMRVNLAVQTSPDFGLQYQGDEPLIAESGDHCIVCTDFNHRVWVRQRSHVQRIHVVFDVLPWMDYDARRDAYSLNSFYGRKHPYDMVADGDIWRAL